MAYNKIEKAKKILFENTPADKILGYADCGNYVEFDCKAGGDLICYRVYNDGSIVEK